MRAIGIDFGSAFFKGVVVENKKVKFQYYRKSTDTVETLKEFLNSLKEIYGNQKFKVGISGITVKERSSSFLTINEIVGLSTAIATLHPETKNVIEIGAHTSKFIIIKNGTFSEFYTNELCAAGTGSFLEQQAKRLKLTVEELAHLAVKAKRAAKIAGRCAVFAKSDMIHLQQKGTPVEEIAYGLCLAIARNSWITLLKGRELEVPVLIAGGCAKNPGIIRAFAEILNLETGKTLLPSQYPGLEVAIGVALEAYSSDLPYLSLEEMEEQIKNLLNSYQAKELRSRPKLKRRKEKSIIEPSQIFLEEKKGYIGIDIGSVSTDFVVLDEKGNVISSVYLPTKGRPVEVILEGLSLLKERFKGGLKVLGCGVTGSGRYLAEKLVGADVVKNEITCQALGTLHFFKDADTIFEIGGQDSKYIYLRNGKIEDFTMNKICAAGTGSFLEEQSEQLGINVFRDFAPLAFESENPLHLNSRCTVFMESEITAARKKGLSLKDICGGLAYAIAENYIEKVVERRKIGKKIVFQGGVASNKSVVAAFESILGRKIEVHPYNRISGAIGAALAAKLYKPKGDSKFRGFDIKVNRKIKTFECKGCPNYCEVSVIHINSEKVFFGDACERFSNRGIRKEYENLPNLAEYYLGLCESYFRRTFKSKGKIGIPRASTLIGYLPFWATFFSELGYQPVLSGPSSEETLLKGVKSLPVSACFPIKLATGHVVSLLEENLDLIFIPAIVTLPGEKRDRSYGCPYTQSIPFMIKLSAKNLISPVIFMDGTKEEFLKSFENYFDLLQIKEEDVEKAYEKALLVQKDFENRLREEGRSLLSRSAKYKVAVLGRPYNLFDPYLNLNLFSHLRRLSVLALPINFLPLEKEGRELNLPWKFPSDIVKAAKKIVEFSDLYPITVSNFGCGPDAFTSKILEEIFGDRPHLSLEFDEHRGEAGLITRLEAFLDVIETNRTARKKKSIFIIHRKNIEEEEEGIGKGKIFIPYFADHAYAFSGALKSGGYKVEVLPPPDEETRRLGEAYSSGKECHAYAFLLGDLVKLTKKLKKREKAIYFFPGTKIPCLLNQYGTGMKAYLKNQGISNIKVFTPYSEDILKLLDMEGAEKLYKGILSIDLLVKASCEVRPYEIRKGLTDEIHKENLLLMEEAVEKGNIIETLKVCLERLQKIRKKNYERRPLVGIAGDIYTRINPFANNDLFKYLEERGIEVWPAPFEIDIIDFGISRSFMKSISELDIPAIISSGGIILKRAIELWKIRRVVAGKIERFEEPGYREILKLASPYVWNEENEILVLNIAKIVDFARNGAQGIINAMCFNCMIGTASAAIIEKIKRDFEGLPIITLVYSGEEHPALKTSLEAFIEQVKKRKAIKREKTFISQIIGRLKIS